MIIKRVRLEPQKSKIGFELVEDQYALIMPVGDVHFGSDGFPVDRFRAHLEWGMERGALFLGMGEYLDFASYSQREIFAPLRDETKRQLDNMVRDLADEFLQIVEFTKGHWLGMLEGDHRWEFSNSAGKNGNSKTSIKPGTSIDQFLCGKLECDFLGTSCVLRLSQDGGHRGHPEADAILYAHHGIGSSRTAGGQLNRVEDLLKWIDADIYLMGHTHAKVAAPIDRLTITPDGKLIHRTKLIARTGAFLRGYISHEPLGLDEPAFQSRGTYVEQKAYMPSSLGGLCIGIGTVKIERSAYYRPVIHYSC